MAKANPSYRKLASVRPISRIKTLDSSQTHEVVMVDGWPVVVEKGQFAVGQQVLYFAIDCVLPLWDSRFEPYRSSLFLVELHGQQGWAVQTVKHEGHISQGMVFSLDHSISKDRWGKNIWILREYPDQFDPIFFKGSAETSPIGPYLGRSLMIRKWSTFYPQDGGVILGRSPSFLPATKSERVQNMPELWTIHGDTEFQITEILDGMPMTVYDVSKSSDHYLESQLPGVLLDDRAENGILCRETCGVSIGGQDYEETEESISWKALKEQGIIDDFLGACNLNIDVGLAGVLCGANIAGNPSMIDGRCFFVYAISDDHFETWKTTDDHDCEWDHRLRLLKKVPKFATRIRLSAFAKDLDELLEKAQGASFVSKETLKKYPSLKRKGLAFRALDGSFSFKVIANDWLLDETEKLRKAGRAGKSNLHPARSQ